ALALPIWLCAWAGEAVLPSGLPPVVWHAHEMVFGYAFASVAGFLLTAIPNWTGGLPLRGRPVSVDDRAVAGRAGRPRLPPRADRGRRARDHRGPQLAQPADGRRPVAARGRQPARAPARARHRLHRASREPARRRHALHADRARWRAHRAQLHAQLAGAGTARRRAAGTRIAVRLRG